jgi:hypothetical protein
LQIAHCKLQIDRNSRRCSTRIGVIGGFFQFAIGNVQCAICNLFLCFFFPAPLAADEVPLVGRPVEFPFSGASARFARQGDELVVPFRLEAQVAPTQVEAEQPVTLTLTVRAVASVLHPPERIDLREVPAFSRRFHIEAVSGSNKEQPSPAVWRWVYHLRPRQVGIQDVPGVPFVFYNPDLRPAEKAFQVLFTDPVRLTVIPPEPIRPPGDPPPGVLQVAGGPRLRAHVRPWHGPGRALLAAVLVPPPLLGLGWYLAWRWLYPDAARLARQRRSRAARRALVGLDGAARLGGRAHAEAVSAAVVLYLRERFDLAVQEPTPGECADWLARFGLAEVLTERLRLLLEDCTAARFGPGEVEGSDLASPARGLVIDLEDATCPPSS